MNEQDGVHLTFIDTMLQLQPLVDGLRQEVLKQVFLHADESHPIMDKLPTWPNSRVKKGKINGYVFTIIELLMRMKGVLNEINF